MSFVENDSGADELAVRCRDLLVELDLISQDEVVNTVPLTGGVSSDIALIETQRGKFCAKFALSRLKVEKEWHAPIHRNAAEYAWLEFVSGILPDNAPRLIGRSQALSGFAMEYIEGNDVYLWKSKLLQGQGSKTEAEAVGSLLASIHSASQSDSFSVADFENHDDFDALRIDPYFRSLVPLFPEVAEQILRVIEQTKSRRNVLVHGDVSPKNILMRDGSPIILDAECTTMGDASFDVAFCLNHLILKSVHLQNHKDDLLEQAGALWDSYSAGIDWEPVGEVEARMSNMLPVLMLARVAGKSPVEYLSESGQSLATHCALELINKPILTLPKLLASVSVAIGEV